MTRIFWLLFAGMTACAPAALDRSVPDSTAMAGYSLVYADEFDRPGLPDERNWAYDTSRNREGWWNRELQYYAARRAKNARVENGVLIIEAHPETLDPTRFPDWGKQRYTSAKLYTRGRAEWLHAYVEVRAKVPCGRGTWPAIWMLPADPDVQWPDGGEIDIMEYVGYNPGKVHHSLHDKLFNFIDKTERTRVVDVPDACGGFHFYRLWWEPGQIRFGIDDAVTYVVDRPADPVKAQWPFDTRPFILILNLAIGGDWGGKMGVDDAALPQRFLVDYVRVYQRGPQPAGAQAH